MSVEAQIVRAKVAEQAERYEDMAKVNRFIHPQL